MKISIFFSKYYYTINITHILRFIKVKLFLFIVIVKFINILEENFIKLDSYLLIKSKVIYYITTLIFFFN